MGIDEWDLKPMDSLNYRHSKDIAYEKPCGKEEQVPSKRLRVHKKRIRITALEIAGREQVWLWDFRQGVSTNTIASRERVSVRRVRFGVARASALESRCYKIKDRLPWLVPLFPIGPFTPRSPCAHHTPIAPGSILCCMVCHRSGWDLHPAMLPDHQSDPAPEPRATSSSRDASPETRRGRRKRLFGSRN